MKQEGERDFDQFDRLDEQRKNEQKKKEHEKKKEKKQNQLDSLNK
jgi:hypothetical protein